jgi:putative polyhydroxyalkanoate system protein
MAKWDVEVSQPHSVGVADARTKVKSMLVDFQRENSSVVKTIRWNADETVATAGGTGFDAEFHVGADRVDAFVKLGLIAKMMKGKVETGLKKALTKAFA